MCREIPLEFWRAPAHVQPAFAGEYLSAVPFPCQIFDDRIVFSAWNDARSIRF